MLKEPGSTRRPMICLVMGGHFSETIGGAQFQVKLIVDALVRSGRFDVTYITRHVSSSYVPVGYTIEKISAQGLLARYTFLVDKWQINRILERVKPDLIYQRGLKGHTKICAQFGKKHGVPVVFHVAHDYDLIPGKVFGTSFQGIVDAVEQRYSASAYPAISGIVTQTTEQKRLLAKNYGLDAAMVFPNLVEIPPYGGSGQLTEKFLVLWVANFKSFKRPEAFVELASRFSDRNDIEFVMIGRPGSPDQYGELHKRIDSMPNLRHLGQQPISAVNDWMTKASVFVNTSVAEGYPNTFLQAWARGVPVLSMSVDVENLLADRQCGFLAADMSEMVTRVNELASDVALREKLSNQAYTYVKANNAVENVQHLIALFEKYIEQREV